MSIWKPRYKKAGNLGFKADDAKQHIDQGNTLVIDHRTPGKDHVFSNGEDQFCDIIIATVRINNHPPGK